MKHVILALLMTAVLSAVAFAGPSLNPWFEISAEDARTAMPTLEAGAIVEGMLSPAWFIDLGVTYSDPDLLTLHDIVGLDFEANIGFDQLVTINTTGSLVYGCLISFTSGVDFTTGNYPEYIDIDSRSTGFLLEGYVGPLTVWGGINFDWDALEDNFIPLFGMRVDFDIDL